MVSYIKCFLVPEVDLIDWDEEAEIKLIISALYPYLSVPEKQIRKIITELSPGEKNKIIGDYIGDRSNRRHIPGRALETSFYRFDILSDYGLSLIHI